MKILEFKNSGIITPTEVIKDFSEDHTDIEFFLGIAANKYGHLEISYSRENAAKIVGYLEAAKLRILKNMRI